ncbi:uncharacterized protein LOC121845167 [Oncorhynchus tshawytscha]|uniref:Uncharacterized protein n=1 Tax=Oncorhynchus tshawytscha TaxID=74940 RepID=A0AAZ3SUV6_ONCTS|nr:uncharacterized protein LOC121845167 [Oncorhynchus tshawytscha]
MVRTLNNMEELRNSSFGRPSPRHGLKLLFWFAKDHIVIKNGNQMVANCDPKERGFGFHHFQNRRENNVNKRLLPFSEYPFYEVGNLHLPTSKSLPEYVRGGNTHQKDDSNMDRLIISMRPDRIVVKVYVTQHEDLKSFDPVNTYCISRSLLMIIRQYTLRKFLGQVGYYTQNVIAPRESGDTRIDMDGGSRAPPSAPPRAAPGFWESYCTIL